jgi:peroxiredoxin family protein
LPLSRVFSVVLFGAGGDRLYEGVSFLAAARARGDTCLLFLRGPALKAYVERRWAPPVESVPEDGLHFQHQSPSDFLDELRSHGKVRVYACSAWVRLLGINPKRVAERVDAVIGLNAFLSQAQDGPLLNF